MAAPSNTAHTPASSGISADCRSGFDELTPEPLFIESFTLTILHPNGAPQRTTCNPASTGHSFS
jgi:hypothetical protein